MDSLPLARLTQAGKRFGRIVALREASFDVRGGEVLAMLGPNGAGKTTALSLLMGLRRPDSGRAELFGRDPRDAQARRRLGVMLQVAQMPDTLTVAEHVRLFSGYYPDPRPLEQTLALAGLQGLTRRRSGALSGGQQRRLQFALAICGRPDLLFVDEPTAGLDVDARRAFWGVLRDLRSAGVGIVLTTHYLEEADALADRIVLLHRGRVLSEGTPAGLKARVAGKRVRCVTALDADTLRGWPEVESLTRDRTGARGSGVELHTRDAETLLRRLLDADPALTGLEVTSLGLEDAMLELTRENDAMEAA